MQLADPRNFDEFYNGERAFIIGGQTFHWRPLHWREWGELIDRRAAEEVQEQEERKRRIEELVSSGKTPEEAEDIIEDETTLVSSFEQVVERCAVYLEPEEVASFKAVMDDKSKPISIAQLNELMVWLQGVQTPDRPTEMLRASSPGPGTSGAISPAA